MVSFLPNALSFSIFLYCSVTNFPKIETCLLHHSSSSSHCAWRCGCSDLPSSLVFRIIFHKISLNSRKLRNVCAFQFSFIFDGGALGNLHLHFLEDAVSCHSRAKNWVSGILLEGSKNR
ncbi:hypothetical protein F8388_014704 [Cannabis sativa]|uniref:Uncharacterized protein n=1 Tax=Cannabis sativa TaxID=3483 RepID=A0A7J6E4K8_CANSA|nr:hypothetical protein F8388_014704 [Cannabis sativa]